ncbi:MAG: hypothetical protein HXS48_19660 [Theionarchaea archaeon]|nr:hypothetical protein [Theionarchaea archaeon]
MEAYEASYFLDIFSEDGLEELEKYGTKMRNVIQKLIVLEMISVVASEFT